MANEKRALILGVTGQDGVYLARELMRCGYCVHGTSRRPVAEIKRSAIKEIPETAIIHTVDPSNAVELTNVVQQVAPCEIYNLSAQSSVGASFDKVKETIDSIVQPTVTLLEILRQHPGRAKLYNASSSEMFGDTNEQPADETTPFRPRSPYAVAKAAAHNILDVYRRSYGVFACSGIMFNHESPCRDERFVTQKIVKAAVDIYLGKSSRLCLGNLDIYRDWGWAPEYVAAMRLMLQVQDPKDYVIATGLACSLTAFVERAFAALGLDWREHTDLQQDLRRSADVRITVGNPRLAHCDLGWRASIKMPEIVELLVAAELEKRQKAAT